MNEIHPDADAPGEAPGPARRPEPELLRDLEALRVVDRPEPVGRPGTRRRRWPWWLLGVLLVGASGGWWGVQRFSMPPEVSLVVVGLRDFGAPPSLLDASGYLEARRQITVSSRAQGKIVEMPVDENQQVREGDLIARIEDDEQRARLKLAAAERRDAEREFRRKVELERRGSISRTELERAETHLQVAEAQHELAQVALDNTVVRAPIDGTVIRKIRDVGEFLTIGVTADGDPGTAVVTLADLSAIDVELEIGETEIRKIEPGAPALVTPEARPERRYLARVVEVAAMADRDKGVVPVRVRIDAPDRDLLPDMTAAVSFLAGEPTAPIEVLPAIPLSALVEVDGRDAVFVVEDQRVRVVPVTVREEGEHAALLSGPEEGAFLVDAPPPGLANGDAIRVEGS